MTAKLSPKHLLGGVVHLSLQSPKRHYQLPGQAQAVQQPMEVAAGPVKIGLI